MSYQASLVIVNDNHRILARQQESELHLPQVEVESGRVGISLSRAVREQLGLEIFCLVLREAVNQRFHVLRLQSPESPLPPGLIWTTTDALYAEREFMDSIDSILREAAVSSNNIAGYAWYSQAAAWLRDRVNSLGYSIRRLEQWNGRVGGVLLRVETNRPELWFKAADDFNARELAIAQALAARHPDHFPRVLAAEPAWNAFLLEHVEGVELNDCDDLDSWKTVAGLLADVQIAWMGKEDVLLRVGAADLRAETLAAKLPEFLDSMEDAMARQPKTPPARLTRADLDELGCASYALCSDVAKLPFARGLANADFSPHNTLITNRITNRGPVFIDWAEACVSLPLIAGEYMLNRMVGASPDRARWQDTLRTTYLCRWAESYGEAQVLQAAKLLPPFALLAAAIFYFDGRAKYWDYSAFLRSLTRRLDREVKKGMNGACDAYDLSSRAV